MGLFPSGEEFAEALGVTPEDRERWSKKREAQLQKRHGTAKQMVDQTAKEGVGLMRMGVESHLYGREAGQAERDVLRNQIDDVETVTRTRTRHRFADEEALAQAEADEQELGGF